MLPWERGALLTRDGVWVLSGVSRRMSRPQVFCRRPLGDKAALFWCVWCQLQAWVSRGQVFPSASCHSWGGGDNGEKLPCVPENKT